MDRLKAKQSRGRRNPSARASTVYGGGPYVFGTEFGLADARNWFPSPGRSIGCPFWPRVSKVQSGLVGKGMAVLGPGFPRSGRFLEGRTFRGENGAKSGTT